MKTYVPRRSIERSKTFFPRFTPERRAQLKSQFQAKFSEIGAPVLDVSALVLQMRAGDVGVRVLRSGFGRSLRFVPAANGVPAAVSNVLEASCPRETTEWLLPELTTTTESIVALDATRQRLNETSTYIQTRIGRLSTAASSNGDLLSRLPSERQLRTTLLESFKLLTNGISASCDTLTDPQPDGTFAYKPSPSTDMVLDSYKNPASNSLNDLLQKFNSANGMSCPAFYTLVDGNCVDLAMLIRKDRRRQGQTLNADDIKSTINQLLPSFGEKAITGAGGGTGDVAAVCLTAKAAKDLNIMKRHELQAPTMMKTSDYANATAEMLRLCTTMLNAKVRDAKWMADARALDVLCTGTQAQAIFVLKRTSTVLDLRQQHESQLAAIESLQQDGAAVTRGSAALAKCMPTINPAYVPAYNLLRSTLQVCRQVSDAVIATGKLGPNGITINLGDVPLDVKIRAAQCKLDLTMLRQAALPLKPAVGAECLSVTRASFTCYRRLVHVMSATFPGTKRCDIVDGFRSALEIYRGVVALRCKMPPAAPQDFCAVASAASATLVSVLPPKIHGLSENPTAQGSCSKLYVLQFTFPDNNIGARADQFKAFMELAFNNRSAVDTVFFDFKPVVSSTGPVPDSVEVGDLGDATEVTLGGVDLLDFGPISQLTTAPPETEETFTRRRSSAAPLRLSLAAAIIALCMSFTH